MSSDIMVGFASIGILVLSLVLIMGLSLLLSFVVSTDSEERAWFRWFSVSIFFALCIALWALN